MSPGMKRLLVRFILIYMVLTLLAPGCGQPPPTPTPEPPSAQSPTPEPPPDQPTASRPLRGMTAQLSLSDPPVLGKPVQLTLTLAMREWYKWDAPHTTARILPSGGFELVDGNLEWQGDVIRGKPVEIKATIKAIKTGNWKIEVKAFYLTNGSYEGSDTNTLYISVFEDHATVSDRVPRTEGRTAEGILRAVPAVPPEEIPAPPGNEALPESPPTENDLPIAPPTEEKPSSPITVQWWIAIVALVISVGVIAALVIRRYSKKRQ